MPNWNSTPVEILVNIIQFAFRAEESNWEFKLQCLLISKHWSMASRKVIYKVVDLSGKDHDKFIAAMFNSSNGSLVRDLHLDANLSHKLESTLGQLLKACPNLITMQSLSGLSGSFFTRLLLELYTTGNGSKLRKLPIFDSSSNESIRGYGYVALALKNTLEEIMLCDGPVANPSFEQDETVDRLEEFTKIRHAQLYFHSSTSIYQLWRKIHQCPSVSTMDIIYLKNKLTYQSDIDVAEPFNLDQAPNITELTFLSPLTVTVKLLQYIIHLFPNLCVLDFEISQHKNPIDTDFLTVAQRHGHQISSELWIQFLDYIVLLKEKCRIVSLFIKEYAEVFAHFPKLAENLEIVYGPNKNIGPYFDIMYNDPNELLSYLGGRHTCNDYSRRLVFNCHSTNFNGGLPHESLLPIYGPMLKALSIKILPVRNYVSPGGSTYNRMADGYLFNPIFKHCQVLDTLLVSTGTFNYLDLNSVKATQCLEMIQFDDCTFGQDFLIELSTMLPDRVEFLLFMQCSINSYKNMINTNFSMIDMPYTSFGCLLWKHHTSTHIETLYFKIMKKSRTLCFKVHNNKKVTSCSSEEVESSKAKGSKITTVYIRCFDVENLVIKVSDNIHFRLRFTKENLPVVSPEEEFMELPEFDRISSYY